MAVKQFLLQGMKDSTCSAVGESLEYLKTVPLHHYHHLVDYPGSGTYIVLDFWMNTSFSLCFMDATEDFNKKMHVSYSNGFEVLDLKPGKTRNL